MTTPTGSDGQPVSRRRAVRTAGLATLAGGLGLAATSTAHGQPTTFSPFVGSWLVRFSAGPGRSEILVIFVFIPGGVFLFLDSPVEPTASQSDDPTQIEFAGPFAGQWLEDAAGGVRASAVQLNYNRLAIATSNERNTLTLTYDAASDTISGTRQWRETTLDGIEILSATGTVRGTRIRADG